MNGERPGRDDEHSRETGPDAPFRVDWWLTALQRRPMRFAALASIALWSFVVGCGGSNNKARSDGAVNDRPQVADGQMNTDVPQIGDSSLIDLPNGGDVARTDAAPGCGTFGQACATGASCCSGMCGSNNTCVAVVGNCGGPGATCASGVDCCSMACV